LSKKLIRFPIFFMAAVDGNIKNSTDFDSIWG